MKHVIASLICVALALGLGLAFVTRSSPGADGAPAPPSAVSSSAPIAAPALPHRATPRPPVRGTGRAIAGDVDARYRAAVPAPVLALIDAPHATGPARHGQAPGARRAERLARLLATATAELGLDDETRGAVEEILARFDTYRHALRQSERRGAIGLAESEERLGVLVRERNFLLRDYLGRERARRIFALERAQRAQM